MPTSFSIAVMEENSEEPFIVIRNYKPGDETGCRQVVHEGIMSTVKPAFFAALTREVTFQIIIIIAAIMFVFMNCPPTICLLSIPISVVIIYISIYLSHVTKAYGMTDDMLNIPRHYMSSQYTGFWVAEVYEPYFFNKKPASVQYKIIKESDLGISLKENRNYTRKIIGTVAITRSKEEEVAAWLRRMAVDANYQRKRVAMALLNEVIEFCIEKEYETIDLVTTECHDAARELYMKKGFELRQLYHKQIIGNLVQVLMYEFSLKLPRSRSKLYA